MLRSLAEGVDHHLQSGCEGGGFSCDMFYKPIYQNSDFWPSPDFYFGVVESFELSDDSQQGWSDHRVLEEGADQEKASAIKAVPIILPFKGSSLP